jgi:sulfur carrier protein
MLDQESERLACPDLICGRERVILIKKLKRARNGGHHQKGANSFRALLFCSSEGGDDVMKLNGKTVPLEQEQTLFEFLAAGQFNCKTVAVERNGVIVPKAEYESIRLANEDTLEIVRFVGGG